MGLLCVLWTSWLAKWRTGATIHGMSTSLNGGSLVRFGWETFKKRPWFFIGVYATIAVVGSGFNYSGDGSALGWPMTLALIIAGVVLAVLQMVLRMGETRLLLNAEHNVDSAIFYDLLTRRPFWKYVGANVLYGCIVMIGFILLIVPGVMWSIKYMFVRFLVIERGMGPIDALRESARMTEGHMWELFWLALRLIGINILGFVCLFVGLLVSVPVSQLATVRAYRTLEQCLREGHAH